MTIDLNHLFDGPNYRIKDQQKALLYATIRASAGITRKELAERHAIRRTTVSNLVQELIDDAIVHEGELRSNGSQGRPQIPLYPSFDRFVGIALYFVSLELKGALVNSGYQILAEETTDLSERTDQSELADSIVEMVEALRNRKPSGAELLGCSVTFPGYVDTEEQTWVYTARWPKLGGFSLRKLEDRIPYPLVCTRSLDAELEYLLGRNTAYRTGGTILVHWGYGIGASYAFNGTVIRTRVGSFAEFGHVLLGCTASPDRTRRCICGRAGCLETGAALWAVLPRLREEDPTLPDDEGEFAAAFAGSELESHPVMDEALTSFCDGLTALITLLAADRVLIYGPFVESDRVFSALVQNVSAELPDLFRDIVEVERVAGGFAGDVFGSTATIFRNGFTRALKAQ